MIAAAAAAGAVVLTAWASTRARVGARVRRIGGARAGVLRTLAAAGPWRLTIAIAAGVTLAGTAGAVIGPVCAVGWAAVRRARARRSRRALIAGQLPEMLSSVSTALRAGRSLTQALEVAREDAQPPLRASLGELVADLAGGVSMDDALERFSRRAGTEEARLASDSLVLGRTAGAGLPSILDDVAASLTEQRRILRAHAAATAQARLSAAVVALLPVAFYVLLGSGARAQLAVLLREPAGWALGATGLALEAAGVLWVRALEPSR